MNIYNIASVTFASFIYIYLARQISKGKAEQNLATWLSWGLLDLVAGISLFAQDGNWYLPTFYVAGCTLILYCIIGSAKFKWGRVETICFLLVIVSVFMWTRSGPWYATVISTVGVVIASYPQLKDAVFTPSTSPAEVFVGFAVANALSTAGGKAWIVEERLYPGVNTILCVLIVVFSLRKYFFVERPRGV